MEMSIGNMLLLSIALTAITQSDAWMGKTRRSSPPLTTRAPTTTPPSRPSTPTHACKPTYGYDHQSNWCYGTYCDENGQLIAWDNWNCRPTTTPPTTTYPPPPTPLPGCFYEQEHYAPGADIKQVEDTASNKCRLVYCASDSILRRTGYFNCY